MTLVGNLTRAGGKNSTDHAVSSAGWLTGALAKQTEAEDIRVGISIDQILAKQVGQETPFPSLEFATEDFSGYVGGCVPGYSCAYMNTISWASETAGLPMEIDPRAAFERMFGRAGSPAERQVRRNEDRSILDSILQEARSLQTKVGAPDRVRLDNYLENIREIERRIQKAEARNAAGSHIAECAAWRSGILRRAHGIDVRPARRGLSVRHDPHLYVHDRTRSQPEDVSGAGLQGDAPRHLASRPAARKRWSSTRRINAYFASLFASFLEKLRNSPEADGSVLDHSLIAFGAGMSDGQAHNSYPLSFSMFGGAGGRVKGDRFIIAPEWTPVANVWLGVASMFGSRIESIGESTGRFEL